jgi:hypothetical protein
MASYKDRFSFFTGKDINDQEKLFYLTSKPIIFSMVEVVSFSLSDLYTHFLHVPSLTDVNPWEMHFAFTPDFLEQSLSHFLNCLWDIHLSLALQLQCYEITVQDIKTSSFHGGVNSEFVQGCGRHIHNIRFIVLNN